MLNRQMVEQNPAAFPNQWRFRDRMLYRVLSALSTDRYRQTEEEIDAASGTARAAIRRDDFETLRSRFGSAFDVAGKRVLEVGCGEGDLAICMAEAQAQVTALDIDGARIKTAESKRLTIQGQARTGVKFVEADFLRFQSDAPFDRIVALESFEHIPAPERFLARMRTLLAPEGKILSIWGPTWLSPFGAHMTELTKVPWVHLLFPEPVVLAVRRAKYRPTDVATRYENVRGGLNRMTVARFRECVAEAGLKLERFEINPQFKGRPIDALNRLATSVPGVGEFFSHTVLCIMSPDASREAS
jgi:ubiquinone/menaquinone biosynthesis C-methylase UbiE